MFFALTDEQRALQSSVRELLADRFPLTAVRTVVDDPAGDGDPAELWKAIGAQGWLAVLVPEEYDGLGLGLLDAAVIARCFGAAAVPGPYLPTLLGGEAVRLAGSADQRARWLPPLAAGEVKLTLITDTDAVASGGRLSGTARHVAYPHVADRLIVATGEHDGTGGTDPRLWLVDPAGDGVTLTRHDTLDRTTRDATVTFTDAAAEPLPGGDREAVAALHARGAVLVANDLVGIARTALTRTVDYVRTREQFGRPVGSFQALKHALADLHTGVTMAEHAGWYAAHALDVALPDAALAVSVAKAKASDVGRDATAAMIQFHGGIGYTWEHDAHIFFKRAKREEYLYGDPAAHRERVAALVIGSVTGSVGAR